MITTYKELEVYKNALAAAIEIFTLSKSFPSEEKYSLTDQVRRSSRSVCSNLAEGWRKRRYRAAFIAKLNDAEGEACETQSWFAIAHGCGYISGEIQAKFDDTYDHIMRQLVRMINDADKWLIR